MVPWGNVVSPCLDLVLLSLPGPTLTGGLTTTGGFFLSGSFGLTTGGFLSGVCAGSPAGSVSAGFGSTGFGSTGFFLSVGFSLSTSGWGG